jgi:hypothetical protein
MANHLNISMAEVSRKPRARAIWKDKALIKRENISPAIYESKMLHKSHAHCAAKNRALFCATSFELVLTDR